MSYYPRWEVLMRPSGSPAELERRRLRAIELLQRDIPVHVVAERLGVDRSLGAPVEASPPRAGPGRASGAPSLGPTAQADGRAAAAVGAPGRCGAGSGGLHHEP